MTDQVTAPASPAPATAPPATGAALDLASMSHEAISAALRNREFPTFKRDDAVRALEQKLRALPEAPVPARPAFITKVADLPDPSLMPATADEAARAASLEVEAFTKPAALATDYKLPEPPRPSEETRTFNEGVRNAAFAAQLPVAVMNLAAARADHLAREFHQMSPTEIGAHQERVVTIMRAKWGDAYDSNLAAVRKYVKGAADRAAAAGQPALREILMNAPEVLSDPASLEMFLNAARHAKR